MLIAAAVTYRWPIKGLLMILKSLRVVATSALFATANSAARADAIGIGDFGPTAVLTDLNNLGNVTGFAPLTVGIYTFTTDDGHLRYANFGANNSLALGNNTDLGFIDISIAAGADANVRAPDFFSGQGLQQRAGRSRCGRSSRHDVVAHRRRLAFHFMQSVLDDIADRHDADNAAAVDHRHVTKLA
jgi:hypothetical protein